MSLGETAKKTVRGWHHRAVEWRYGLRTGTRTVQVTNASADFYVSNWKEYWRADGCMGEREFVEQVLDWIDAETVFWDVGAAIGTWSCLAAAAGAEVLAFEPIPENAQRITENAGLNDQRDRVTVHPVALSDREGTTTIRPSQRIAGEGTHRIAEAPERAMDVPITCGDEIEPGPDVLKIDVEGHEPQVLDGMFDHLPNVRAIIVEAHPQHGVDVAALRTRLQAFGFGIDTHDTSNRGETFLLGTADRE